MLRDRFDYASTWREGIETWLALSTMAAYHQSDAVFLTHAGLREHAENSAPALFSDEQLALFSVVEDVEESLTYLVWAVEAEEPEVWRYSGMETCRFNNLADFLTWFGSEGA